MFSLFYKYLILHKSAGIPGVGVFQIGRRPARLDFASKLFTAPAMEVHFKPQTLADDHGLYNFISQEMEIDVTEASVRYYDFTNKLRKTLTENGSAELPELGTLLHNAAGELYFKATGQFTNYFPAAAAERVLRENTEHPILVGDNNRTHAEMKEMLVDDSYNTSDAKDYWWIFAIALGIIGIATIVYYYLHNGTLR